MITESTMVFLRALPLVVIVIILLTACGIRRPLIAPRDIPAYEAAQQKKAEKFKKDAQVDDEPSDDDSAQ